MKELEPHELIEEEIGRLKRDLENAKKEDNGKFLSLYESIALTTIGSLGVVGSAWMMARLLQHALPVHLLENADFAASLLASIQRGLGRAGVIAAAGLGWLVLVVLVVVYLWPRLVGGRTTDRLLWPGWIIGLGLVSLPFYEVQAVRPSLSIFIGLAVISGIYTVVAFLRYSGPLVHFFERFGESRFGIAFAGGTLVLLLVGALVPFAPSLMVGLLLGSSLSFKLLFLGIHNQAKRREVDNLNRQISSLQEKKIHDEERRRIRQELDHFIDQGSTQPV